MEFHLANFTVRKGQKVSGFLTLPFTDEGLPATIIYGEEDGDTVLITGGVHNAEYVGIEAVTGLARELEPKDVRGILILIHIVNINGFRARTVSVSREDGKNLNRVFPGSMDGTFTDKLAYFMEKELFSRINYYIDVHNGDWFEDLTPFIYSIGNAAPKAEEMAKRADVPFYVKSGIGSGGAYNYAGTLGVPSVLIERGCKGQWSEEEAEASRKDVRNILRYLGVLMTEPEPQRQVPVHMHHVHYLDSVKEGCWHPFKNAGDAVKKGECIGVLKDYFGNVIEEVRMREDAVILYQTISYSVPADSPLVAYGHYGECVDEIEEEAADQVPDDCMDHSHEANGKFFHGEHSHGEYGPHTHGGYDHQHHDDHDHAHHGDHVHNDYDGYSHPEEASDEYNNGETQQTDAENDK